MTASPKALVLHGDGINCENETAYGLSTAGFEAALLHTSELLQSTGPLLNAKLLVLPGGFSFGDEIASGKVLALKLRDKLADALHDFLDRGNFVIGICNGFQILTQLGILPDSDRQAPKTVSLCHNNHGRFMDRWVELEVDTENRGQFFQGLEKITLPVRHGEGRVALSPHASAADEITVKSRSPLRYEHDINGSFDRIAALTNKKGNCLGLMPHPEAFVRWSQHPAWTALKVRTPDTFNEEPHGLTILKNTFKALA